MFANTYTLGTLTFTKTTNVYPLGYVVSGDTPSTARKGSISLQLAAKGRVKRHKMEMNEIFGNPLNNGELKTGRLYLVAERPDYVTEAQMEALRVRLVAWATQANFVSLLNGEN